MTDTIKCYTEGCENQLSETVASYSSANFGGKLFCFECQKKQPKIETQRPENPMPKGKNISPTQSDVIKIAGKNFMTYEGLLKRAHGKGRFSMTIIESWVSEDMKMAWCKVKLKSSDQEFDGFGSSTPENTGSMTQSHPIEMAHTRAKGRALRDYLNIGMVMVEELKETKNEN